MALWPPSDEDLERAEALRQCLEACCCRLFGRPLCAPCEEEQRELAVLEAAGA